MLRLACADGTTGSLVVAAGATGTHGTEAPFVVPDGTSCTVTETATGENARAELDSTTIRAGSAPAVSAKHVSVTTSAGHPVTVAVTDVYGGLAPSGAAPGTTALALAGLALVLAGAALTLAAARRHG